MNTQPKTRVLVVDDSAIVRKVISTILSEQSDLEVVGTAPDPYVARDKILALQPDVLTLDIEMPRMDGLTFLEKIMRHHPMPVIVISSLTQSSTRAALEAMSRGAVDVLAKPGGPYSVGDLKLDLPNRVRAAARARLKKITDEAPAGPATPAVTPAKNVPISDALRSQLGDTLIAIGASTGGTQAIERVLRPLPAEMPPIVVAQHIPPGFSAAFAERLNRCCALEVKEAQGNETLRPGLVLIAPGDHHLVIDRVGGGWRARLDDGPKVCYQRPSVDVLFQSVARSAGGKAIGMILTGMGDDGANGLLQMRKDGARTLAQDEASCVVFGMPKEAIARGAAERVLPLEQMHQVLLTMSRQKPVPSGAS